MSGRLLTVREIYSKGLIAGLSYSEMRHLEPGFILDMFAMRFKYDARLIAPKAAAKLFGGG